MTITIYGSYLPEREEEILRECKKTLISDGYSETKLVKDYDAPTSSSLEASTNCLLFSDVNFLVFTKGGHRRGLVRELAFIFHDKHMRRKDIHCTIFDEHKRTSSIPSLSRNDIEEIGLKVREFTTIDELKQRMVKEAYLNLKRLAPSLRRRH